MKTHVEVSGLRIVVQDEEGQVYPIVKDARFSIPKGEVLALIGESGSGKTTIALALMGYARPGCHIAGGAVRIGDQDILSLDRKALTELRGSRISYIAQSAAAAFNPSKSIIEQVIEPACIHGVLSRPAAEAKAVELFRALALPDPEGIGARYPHQLSGGQLQRLMAAMALITDPELIIFDEPTTALDVTTQVDVLKAFKHAIAGRDVSAVYVSHDLSVVAQMADRIVVLNGGEIRECGTTVEILHAPQDPYTRSLIAAVRPARSAAGKKQAAEGAPLLEIRGLDAGYGAKGPGGTPRNIVLRDIDLRIEKGETIGVIGESGSGKSTLARVIAGLLPPASGTLNFAGAPLPPGLAGRTREHFQRIQIVFQSADTALNPAHSVGRILGRPLALYKNLSGPARDKRVAEILDLVKLPSHFATRQCGELSGGQKQRINLARALAAEPHLILCDEVTSALDTVVGAAIIELMAELKRELGLSYLFISHDISTVRAIADRIVVLYAGVKVQEGVARSFDAPPFHPYVNLLISSVPEMRKGWLEETQGSAASDAGQAPAGLCPFLPRCPARIRGICEGDSPSRRTLSTGGEILCHRDEADLMGRRPSMLEAALP